MFPFQLSFKYSLWSILCVSLSHVASAITAAMMNVRLAEENCVVELVGVVRVGDTRDDG